ncbi:hypothetical protein [Micromonospora chalcea]|uniref:hypothetical protein n=1 Tax=Micromonospora chalcea TaxID=1874 RepID=UPI0038F6B7F9
MDVESIRSFLEVRRARGMLFAAVIAGVLTMLIGAHSVAMPMAVNGERGAISIWRMLAIIPGILPALSLHSPLGDLEQMSTRSFRRYERAFLGIVSLLCAGTFLICSAFSFNLQTVAVIARALPAWLGLALIGGKLMGWRLSWTLPTFAATVVWYWGYQGEGRYAWWEFTARPFDDSWSLLLSMALFGLGLLAYEATPWRRREIAGRLGQQ